MSWLLGHVNSDDEEETKQKTSDGQQEPAQDKEESGFTSFWGAINTLKAKSLSAIETTKKDFSEFGSAFSNETKEIREEVTEVFKSKPASEQSEAAETESQPSGPGVLARAEEKLTDNLEKISQGVENLAEKVWGGAVTLLPSIFGMSGIEENVESDQGGRITKEQELKLLQSNSLTYSGPIEPENTEAFEKLTQDFADRYDSYWGQEVTKMLGNPLVRAHYDQLVPEVISEDAFWCHYVFRKRALEQKHERKQQLESRLAQTKDEDSDLAWDDDDESPSKHQPAGLNRSDSNTNDLSTKGPRTPPPTPFSSSDTSLETPLSSMDEGSLILPPSLSAKSSPVIAASPEPLVSSQNSSTQAVVASTDSLTLPASISTPSETCTSPSSCPDIVSSSPPASPAMLPLDSPASFTAVPSEPSLARKDSSASSLPSAEASEPSLVSIPSVHSVTASPAEAEVAVMHMHREVSGSPENSDWESQRLPPSQSDSEPWEPGVEDAVLKAMCDTPDVSAAELDGLEGLILVPQGEDDAAVPKADDWDQWE